MAFRITRAERAQLDTLLGEAKSLHGAVNDAIRVFNELREEYMGALDAVRARVQDEYDEKSYKWQEGERAGYVAEWISNMEGLVSDCEEEMKEVEEQDWINNADELSDGPEE